MVRSAGGRQTGTFGSGDEKTEDGMESEADEDEEAAVSMSTSISNGSKSARTSCGGWLVRRLGGRRDAWVSEGKGGCGCG